MLLSRALAIFLLAQVSVEVLSFQPTTPWSSIQRSGRRGTLLELDAKKKKGRGGGPKGFGKVDEKVETPPVAPSKPAVSDSPMSSASASAEEPPKGAFLQSVAGGTSVTPEMEQLPPEERAKNILREKYGMKTLEEQQANEKQIQQLKAQRKKLADLKRKAELDQDIDVIAMIPAPILKGLDTFLKAGVAISGLTFILAGIGITAEAWSKASGDALPENIDAFIVNTIEPNFTPGLFVVLGFSVCLGLLSAASLGSEGAQYREE